MVKIAIPKSGRLHNETLKCFTEAGFKFEKDNTGFQLHCTNADFILVLMREKDIPVLVNMSVVENGICGKNTLQEFDWNNFYDIKTLYNFPFGKCRLSIAGKTFLKKEDLKDLNVATSYCDFLSANASFVQKIIYLHGSVEHAIELGIADAIVDIVETGETLKKSGLVEGETLLHSQAILIGKNNFIIEDILFKIQATMDAKNKKYIALNCKEKDIELICHYLPSKTPTIVPLSTECMFAIHALCNEEELFRILNQLKKVGAMDIVITTPEKIIF